MCALGAILLSAISLSRPTYAESSTLSLTVSPSISLNLSGVSVTRNSGTSSPTAENIKVGTNNYTGYTLNIAGVLATASPLINTDVACVDTASCQIESIAGDSTYTSPADFNSNAWGYKVTKYNGATWDNVDTNPDGYYLASPTTTAAVLDITNTANDTENTYNLTLGAKIDSSLQPGTYKNTFVVTAVANPIPYSITYANAEGATDVTNMPSPNPQIGSGLASITLSSVVPVREGYSFNGWCTVVPTTVDDVDSCADAVYQAGGEYTLNQTGDGGNTVTLYAVWGTSACKSTTTMQEVDATQINAPTQLCDERDGKLYWVDRLPDGKVWMTQNLDLALGAPNLAAGNTDGTLTPADSNVSTDWTPAYATQTYQYKDINGVEHEDALWYEYIDGTYAGDYNTMPHSYRPASDLGAGTSWTDTIYDMEMTFSAPVYMENGTTMTDWKTEAECVDAGHSQSDCQHWSVGTLYSWFAATAGSGNGDVTTIVDVSDSVCPAGWRLPTGGDSGELKGLVTAGNITTSNVAQGPWYFVLGGGFMGIMDQVGIYGDYWSSTSGNQLVSYLAVMGASVVSPADYSLRPLGVFVRCVADY